LDNIVAMVSHKDCIPEVKEVYINFLNHCDNQVTSLFNKPALHLGASKASKIFRSSRLQSAHLSRESSQSQLSVRFDRTIIEGLQDIVVLLEAQLHPLVQAESSVIVDVLYRPEYLLQPGTEARKKCDNGGFIRR
jgi:hypothetical protein